MHILQRLLCTCVAFATIILLLEVSNHFSDKHNTTFTLGDVPDSLANNLPDIIFNNEFLRWNAHNKCAKFPYIHEILTTNIYWQVLPSATSPTEDYFLYGAYYDSREHDVKVLTLINGTRPGKVFCNVWFVEGVEPITVEASAHYIWNTTWRRKEHLLNGHLFSCSLPNESDSPEAVSLTREPCAPPTNLLKVNHGQPEHEQRSPEFVVCVPYLDTATDVSDKLIEWLELVRLLGADFIHFYVANIHQNVTRVLEYYQNFGWVQIDGWTAPLQFPRISKPQAKRFHLVPINDCFYKHRAGYKYVVVLDIDEMIIPKVASWLELVEKMRAERKVDGKDVATFAVLSAYFFDEALEKSGDVPQYMHMLQHVYRSQSAVQPEWFCKGFYSTEHTLSLHRHRAIACINSTCICSKVPFEDAKIAHYSMCPKVLEREWCNQLVRDAVRDDTIRQFEVVLQRNVDRVREELHLNG